MSGPSLDDRLDAAAAPVDLGRGLERRGRAWLLWSFLLCPCHLPLTLAALTTVLAGTSFGVVLRDQVWVAGTLITAAWLVGTGYGFRLIRQAERANGTCPVDRDDGPDPGGGHRALGDDGSVPVDAPTSATHDRPDPTHPITRSTP